MDLASLTSCRELTMEHADEAARSSDRLRALLSRLAQIAEPEEGAPKVLIVVARLARGDVPWLEGDVTVEITGNDEQTVVDLFKEEGWGIKERLAPQTNLRVPFEEFERAVEFSAKRFAPLKATIKPNKIVLSSASNLAASDGPPAVQLDEKSIGTAPPPPLGIPQEPEPFELPPPSEPDPFDAQAIEAATEGPFGPTLDEPDDIDPALAAAIVSAKKKPAPVATPATPAPPATPPTPPTPPTPGKKPDPVHSRPTVRRMVAIKPEALRTGRKDPRREDDE